MDMADQASDLTEQTTQAALDAHGRRLPRGPSLTFCVDCDDPIPHQRRALGGICRCIGCQEIHELRLRR